ncbi:MAG: hypothetical protein RI580_15315 [Halothece sp. Uz-M2-17]|nr:hypothetical protein [Halothece sp. Uz-M2-17]
MSYYRQTGKKADQISKNRDLSIFNKGNIRSPLHFVPTLLTAIGILGTFWGISQGLQGIALENINNTDALLNNSTELLAGMKTAFTTSLWGLGGASLFIFVLAASETLKRMRRNSLMPKIREQNNRNQPPDPIEQLGKISKKLEGLATLNAQNIGEEVANALKPSFQEVRTDLQTQNETLQELGHLKPEIIGEEVATALKPTFEEIKTDLNLQRETIENQRQELLQTLIAELKTEVIEPVITRLDESAATTQEASSAVKELKEELGGISESLATSIQTIQQFQQQTLGQLETFAQNLQQILDQFKTDTQGVMQQVATDINHAVDQSISGMEAQRTAFAESAEQASTTFRGIREDLEQALTTQAQQQKTMLEEVQTSTQDILQEANHAFVEQSNTLTRVGNEASDIMSNASDNLNGTLTNIDSMLQNTRKTVQQELENFRITYQNSLNQFFEQQNNLLEETLGKQREGLEEVVKELQRVFQEDAKNMTEQVIESMEKIQITTKAVSDLANTTGLASSERLEQIQEIARTLGSESKKINQAYENLIHNFNLGLETWNDNLTKYFEQANETYQQGRQESEQAAAEVCNQLNETSQGLMGVAQCLVAVADDLRNSDSNR